MQYMVCQAMGVRLSCLALLILAFEIHRCFSLNSEGLALLKFRERLYYDPYGALDNWNPLDHDPCMWLGIRCLDGKVQMLDLTGRLLEGTLAPELGNLTQLKFLIISKNHLSGTIPKQFGQLVMLEMLDLRDNNLSGLIPEELGELRSLKHLLLCNNNFEGRIPLEIERLNLLIECQFDENLTSAVSVGLGCVNRKLGQCIWQSGLKQLKVANSFLTPIKETLIRYLDFLPVFNFTINDYGSECAINVESKVELHAIRRVQNTISNSRRKLAEESINLAAIPVTNGAPMDHIASYPSSRSSGSFPAVPSKKKDLSPPTPSPVITLAPQHNTSNTKPPDAMKPNDNEAHASPHAESGNSWKYILVISTGGVLLGVVGAMFFICRSRAAKTIGPWKTGLSGQLQKAFVTGVPNLNRAELETACEDFSNIIITMDAVTIYKGTLSSGVEIGVASTAIASFKDWSKRAEIAFRKKIDMLSRVNHKNFINLIGYCEENEPFARMMVFEYAPNGTLFEHLHVKEVEHLDWSARMRIIMGTTYCLEYMHNLNPPVAHSNLNSSAIFLTDDYAAKVGETSFWSEFVTKSKSSGETESEHSELPPLAVPETNVYNFGIMLLEIISGKLPFSEEQGPLVQWAAQYLGDKRSISYLIDPTLKSFKNNELDAICEVIQECTQSEMRMRPSMNEITSKLRQVLDISPESATPRLSPLWWAELEILSSEAT